MKMYYICDEFNGKNNMNGNLVIYFPLEITSDYKLRVGNNLLELSLKPTKFIGQAINCHSI